MSKLLTPVALAKLSLKNRVVLSPMCMYEVKQKDGVVTPFHFAHYGARAIAQVGLIMLEATAVHPDGRISDYDLGLWNDAQEAELTKLVATLHELGSKVGIQLNHAGRKAADAVSPLAPSALRFSERYAVPNEMALEDIKQTQKEFIDAANRAVTAGVEMIELHGAHGYLINQFLAPATNQRTDAYGGNLENRYRFVQEIIQEIRTFYRGSLWIRLSLTDYAPDAQENSLTDWQKVGQWLEADGIDCFDISTGGLLDQAPNIPIYSGYQVPFTRVMKEAVSVPVTAVGLLDDPGLCEYLLQTNQTDLALLGRTLLRNTNWLAEAAHQLHDPAFNIYNHSYQRGQQF